MSLGDLLQFLEVTNASFEGDQLTVKDLKLIHNELIRKQPKVDNTDFTTDVATIQLGAE